MRASTWCSLTGCFITSPTSLLPRRRSPECFVQGVAWWPCSTLGGPSIILWRSTLSGEQRSLPPGLLRRHVRGGLLGAHLRNAEREGLRRYLRMERFVHANTDGPESPFARVYDLACRTTRLPGVPPRACPQGVHACPTAAGAWRSSGTFDGLAPLGRARSRGHRQESLKLTDWGTARARKSEGSASAQSAFDLDGPRMLRQLQAKGQVGARCGREGHQ